CFKVVTDRWEKLLELADDPAEALLDVDAGALDRGGGAAITPGEPHAARELVRQKGQLGAQAALSAGVGPGLGLRKLLAQLRDAPLVGLLGGRIERLARVAEIDDPIGLARAKVQHVKLASGILHEHVEDLERPRVAQSCDTAATTDRPHITLSNER